MRQNLLQQRRGGLTTLNRGKNLIRGLRVLPRVFLSRSKCPMKKLDASELERLLGRVGENHQEVPAEVKRVFAILVETTLGFRDRQAAEFGTSVTVEDVQAALGWLADFFRTGRWPRTNHLLRRELFETWMTHLKRIEP